MKNKTLNIIIFALIILFGGYYAFKYYPQVVFFKKNSEEMETKTGSEKKPEMTEEEQLQTAIKEAIIAKRGDFGDLKITISAIIDGTYAKGGAMPADGSPGGGMWFAKKVDGSWELVWDGNGAIFCSDLEDYEDFPVKLIPECYDEASMKTVVR